MKTKLFITTLLVIFGLVLRPTAYAQTPTCGSIYGGGQLCPPYISLSISKTVQSPAKNGAFVSGLSEKDLKFEPNQQINFRITVKNTGDTNLYHVTIQDKLPDTISFVSGNGTYDAKTKILTMTQDNLSTQQTMVFSLSGKIVSAANLPKDNKNITCSKNTATATAANGLTESSSSSFCIEKNVLGVSIQNGSNINSTPATGAETWVLVAFLPLAGIGIFLKRLRLVNLISK